MILSTVANKAVALLRKSSCSLRALDRLAITRAYAMQKGTAKARVAYQDLLPLWKGHE